jgi:hypothetical protein
VNGADVMGTFGNVLAPLPPVNFAQSVQSRYFKSGLQWGYGGKVLFSKNDFRKVFEKRYLARLDWSGRGGFLLLLLVLPPVSIIEGVSRPGLDSNWGFA